MNPLVWYYALWAAICAALGIRGIWYHDTMSIAFGLSLSVFCIMAMAWLKRMDHQ